MNRITIDMPICEIETMPGFDRFSDFLMKCRKSTWEKIQRMSIKEMKEMNMISDAESVLNGLKHMQDLLISGIPVDQEIWTEEEKKKEPDRYGTKLFYFPGKPDTPFVLICPGGGYRSVCSFLEGFPAAVKLNQAGYNVFILSYRVRQEPLMPKPMEDVVRALRHILDNSKFYRIHPAYSLMGFSAGGHLAAEMITDNMGLINYGIPMPRALVLCYAAIDLRVMGTHEVVDDFKKAFIKERIQQDEERVLEQYCVNLHLCEKCPPVYFWQCEDDEIVPVENFRHLEMALKEKKIPYQGVLYSKGGHGLIKPHDSFAQRWMEDVILFLDNIYVEIDKS